MITQDDLFARLDALGITHETITHPPMFTVEDSQALRGNLSGGHSKNLFLKDKKGQLNLVVAEESSEINLKHLHKHLSTEERPVGRLSFGKPDLLMEVLGMIPGAVNPFAVMNDKDNQVQVYLDAALTAHELVNFHPLVNTATTTLKSADLVRFLEAENHAPIAVDFTKHAEPAA